MPKAKERLQFNPICLEYEPLSPDDLKALADDIRAHGQKIPIQLDAEGRILDGKNRYAACIDFLPTVRPKLAKWKGRATDERYRAFVESHNDRRRHETAAQRAARIQRAAAKVNTLLKGGNQPEVVKNAPEICENPNKLEVSSGSRDPLDGRFTIQDAANEAGVSRETMKRAVAIERKAPDIAERIKAGAAGPDVTPAKVLRDIEAIERHEAAEEPVKDALGNALPDHVAKAFADAADLAEHKRTLEAVRSAVSEMVKEHDPCARFVDLQDFVAALNSAVAILRFAMPHCLCPKCAGDKGGCNVCRTVGWLPKQLYKQVIPEADQWRKK